MARRIRIKWCRDLLIEGCGDDLTAKFKGELQRRRAPEQAVEITLTLGRCMVRAVLEQIGQMHERDRARIEYELARIRKEAGQLLAEKKSG